MVTLQCGINDASSRHTRGDAFLQGFGEVFAADQTTQATQKLTHVHASAVVVSEAFQEDRTCESQATE
jgi:hypothetical protein